LSFLPLRVDSKEAQHQHLHDKPLYSQLANVQKNEDYKELTEITLVSEPSPRIGNSKLASFHQIPV